MSDLEQLEQLEQRVQELLDSKWGEAKRLLLSIPGVRLFSIGFILPSFNIENYSLALTEPTEDQLQAAAFAFALIPFSLLARKEEGKVKLGLSDISTIWLDRESPRAECFEHEGKLVVSFYLRGGWSAATFVPSEQSDKVRK